MEVGRNATIHGIPASALKALLAKRDGRFTTPQAMEDLGLVEPAATDAMVGLARDGFVEFAGRPNGIDIWEVGEAGRRLMASRIQKRFPAREGRRIADAVVAAAREANTDAGIPVRVTWIAVFGSMLDANDDDLVGDVDLIVRVNRRRLPKDDLRRLEQALLATAPPRGKDRLAPYWSTISLLRRLRRISPKASLMDQSTLDLGVRHRPIYAYDVRTEAEVQTSGRIRTSKAVPGDGVRIPEVEAVMTVPDPRPWPDGPGPRTASDDAAPDRLAHGSHLVAQHMWRRGAALEEISARVVTPARTLQAYLAAQSMRPDGPPIVAGSLRATLAANVPAEAAVVRKACAMIRKGRESGIQLTLFHGEETCSGTMTGATVLLEGAMSLAPLVERASAAAERWRKAAARALKGVEATCRVCSSIPAGTVEVGHDIPDIALLKSACEAWLQTVGPVQASFGPHGRDVHVEVGGPNGPKVRSSWKDQDPSEDGAILAEVARLSRAVGEAGALWTFWFSNDDITDI